MLALRLWPGARMRTAVSPGFTASTSPSEETLTTSELFEAYRTSLVMSS